MSGGPDDSLHGLSYQMGRNAEGLENLNRLFAQHCEDDDRRHGENVALLRANNDAIGVLAKAFAPLVANQALSKRRMALVASIGISFLVGISWAIEAALKWAVGWLLSLKFGG